MEYYWFVVIIDEKIVRNGSRRARAHTHTHTFLQSNKNIYLNHCHGCLPTASVILGVLSIMKVYCLFLSLLSLSPSLPPSLSLAPFLCLSFYFWFLSDTRRFSFLLSRRWRRTEQCRYLDVVCPTFTGLTVKDKENIASLTVRIQDHWLEKRTDPRCMSDDIVECTSKREITNQLGDLGLLMTERRTLECFDGYLFELLIAQWAKSVQRCSFLKAATILIRWRSIKMTMWVLFDLNHLCDRFAVVIMISELKDGAAKRN